MRLPWKLKSFAFSLIDVLHADPLLSWLQKNVTRRSRISFDRISEDWKFHEAALRLLPRRRVLEFGAGKSLVQNLYLSRICESQVVVDINPMFDPELANDAAHRLKTLTGRPMPAIGCASDLSNFNITYVAPLDIAKSTLPDASFDACISTNTMEHIPEPQLRAILIELRRLLVPGGMVSAIIDYSDHYSHTDPTIGRLNFLQFTDRQFERYNHRAHYQNRLRHKDYAELFRGAGFEIEHQEVLSLAELPEAIVSDDPRRRDPDFAGTAGRFIARNPAR